MTKRKPKNNPISLKMELNRMKNRKLKPIIIKVKWNDELNMLCFYANGKRFRMVSEELLIDTFVPEIRKIQQAISLRECKIIKIFNKGFGNVKA